MNFFSFTRSSTCFNHVLFYGGRVKLRSLEDCARCFVLVVFCLASHSAVGKPVHLRNQTITPSPSPAAAAANSTAAAPMEPPATGLFLVQFAAPPSAAEREQLRASGVELLQYVP